MNATIFGRIGRDAELKETQSDTMIARVSVALNVYSKQERETTWVNATLFGKQAETLAQYLTKGSSVAMTGDLKLREFEGDSGTRTVLDMNVQAVALLGAGNGQSEQAKPAARPAQVKAASAGATKGGYRKPAAAEQAEAEDEPF
jgi:single-strand DNA-binding protein